VKDIVDNFDRYDRVDEYGNSATNPNRGPEAGYLLPDQPLSTLQAAQHPPEH
jgi:hypothetical protein